MRIEYWRRVPPLCNGIGSNADKVQDSETSLLVSKKADRNYIEDTETTPKSCLDVVFELLATTRCLNQFGFLSLNIKLKDIDQIYATGSRRTEEVPAEFRCILSGATASVGGFKRQTRES